MGGGDSVASADHDELCGIDGIVENTATPSPALPPQSAGLTARRGRKGNPRERCRDLVVWMQPRFHDDAVDAGRRAAVRSGIVGGRSTWFLPQSRSLCSASF